MRQCSIVSVIITISLGLSTTLEASWSQRIRSVPPRVFIGGLASVGACYLFIQHKKREYNASFCVLPFERDEHAAPCSTVTELSGSPDDAFYRSRTHIYLIKQDHSLNSQFGKCVQRIKARRADDGETLWSEPWQSLPQANLSPAVETQIRRLLPGADDIVVQIGPCCAPDYRNILSAGRQGIRGGAYITSALEPYSLKSGREAGMSCVTKEAVEQSKVVLAPGVTAEDIVDDLANYSKGHVSADYWQQKKDEWKRKKGMPGAQIVFTNGFKAGRFQFEPIIGSRTVDPLLHIDE